MDSTTPDGNPLDPTPLDSTWRSVVAELEPNQAAWLTSSKPISLHEGLAIIEVPDDFTRNQIEGRLRGQLEDALSAVYGGELRLVVTMNPEATPAPDIVAESIDRQDDLSTNAPLATVLPLTPSNHLGIGMVDPEEFPDSIDSRSGLTNSATAHEARLNPKYTFETFVIGSSNRFPHAAAVAVSEAPGKAYNPLLVYGDSGLGKTHLLHAIGHYVRSLYTGARVRYVSSEEFTNEFINAIRDDRQDRFKRAATATSTCCSSTTSSSWRARPRPRRSSSTPSTRSTTPTSRSC